MPIEVKLLQKKKDRGNGEVHCCCCCGKDIVEGRETCCRICGKAEDTYWVRRGSMARQEKVRNDRAYCKTTEKKVKVGAAAAAELRPRVCGCWSCWFVAVKHRRERERRRSEREKMVVLVYALRVRENEWRVCWISDNTADEKSRVREGFHLLLSRERSVTRLRERERGSRGKRWIVRAGGGGRGLGARNREKVMRIRRVTGGGTGRVGLFRAS